MGRRRRRRQEMATPVHGYGISFSPISFVFFSFLPLFALADWTDDNASPETETSLGSKGFSGRHSPPGSHGQGRTCWAADEKPRSPEAEALVSNLESKGRTGAY